MPRWAPSRLRRRARIPELMDAPDLDAKRHEAALRGLGRLNLWSRAAPALYRAVRPSLPPAGRPPWRLLDVACGGGDVPIRMARRAARDGRSLCVAACDFSPRAVDWARRRAAACGADVRFFVLDALRDPIPDGYDCITCSLFLHHLADDEATALLGRLAAAARRLLLVSDLRRCTSGYLLALLATRLLTHCEVVRVDGPRSVAAAFSLAEARGLARSAGLDGAVVRPVWPRRFLLSWSRDDA